MVLDLKPIEVSKAESTEAALKRCQEYIVHQDFEALGLFGFLEGQ